MDIVQMIDQTLLTNDADEQTVRRFSEEAKAFPFKAICVYGAQAAFCREILGDSPILLCTVAGFPSGQSAIDVKVFEAECAIREGAKEIDYVVNLSAAKSGNWTLIEEEMKRITDACHNADAGCKVIFENCALTDDEKKKLCEISLRVRPDFIKTSTGFGSHGATIEDVRLMKSEVGDEVAIKAAGGIRTLESARQMIEAGASRIGTSRGAEIARALAQ